MPKNRPGGRKRPHELRRPRPTGRKPGPATPSKYIDLGLMREVRDALAEDHPGALLVVASGVMSDTEPQPSAWFPKQPDPPTLHSVVAGLLDVDRRETTALLTVIAALTGDEDVRAGIIDGLTSRRHGLPSWLAELDTSTPSEAVELVDIQRDGDSILIGLDLPRGHEATVSVFIDHNLGTTAKDGYLIQRSLEVASALLKEIMDDPYTSIRPLDLADAKVRVADAVEHGSITFPPHQTDTWPATRPLVNWVLRMLPDGGTGYVRREWSEDEQKELAERFFASTFAEQLDAADREDHRGLMESILWYGTGYGTGDPLHWTPVSVELILGDWIPRKIVADVEYLSKAPALLRAFIPFAHAEQDMPAVRTREALAAVDEWEPDYQTAIRSPRPQGVDAIMAAMGVDVRRDIDDDLEGDLGDDDELSADDFEFEVEDEDAADVDDPALAKAFEDIERQFGKDRKDHHLEVDSPYVVGLVPADPVEDS